jgi:hypothetical protein
MRLCASTIHITAIFPIVATPTIPRKRILHRTCRHQGRINELLLMSLYDKEKEKKKSLIKTDSLQRDLEM